MKKTSPAWLSSVFLAIALLVVAGVAGAAGAGNSHGMTMKKAKQIRQTMAPKAQKGDANAQYNMGVLYANGYGVDRDFTKAREWYEKAAAQHQAKAEQNLGIFYLKGQGVDKDAKKAAHWFARAARDGLPAAQNNLSVLYARGDGVPKDFAQAAIWAARAARAGNSQARDNLSKLVANLPKRFVRANGVELRSEPNAKTHVMDRLAADTRVVRLADRDDWSQVLLPATHRIGWVSKDDLVSDHDSVKTASSKPEKLPSRSSESAHQSGAKHEASASRGHAVGGSDARKTVAADTVNVHSKPSRSAPVIFHAELGTKITVERAWHGWRFARFPNGRKGWIAGFLLTG